MSFFAKVKHKMGKGEAIPTVIEDLIARHKHIRDEARALHKAARALSDAHTAVSIATMDFRAALDSVADRSDTRPADNRVAPEGIEPPQYRDPSAPSRESGDDSEIAYDPKNPPKDFGHEVRVVSGAFKEAQCLSNDCSAAFGAVAADGGGGGGEGGGAAATGADAVSSMLLVPYLDHFLAEAIPRAKDIRDRYKNSHLVLGTLSDKVKEAEGKSSKGGKHADKLKDAKEDLDRHTAAHDELQANMIKAYNEIESERDANLRRILGQLCEAERDALEAAAHWFQDTTPHACHLQGKEPPAPAPKRPSSLAAAASAGAGAVAAAISKPKLWQPGAGAATSGPSDADVASAVGEGTRKARPGSIPPPAPPHSGSLGAAGGDAEYFNPAVLDKGGDGKDVFAALAGSGADGAAGGESLQDLEIQIQVSAAKATLVKARGLLDTAKDAEDFVECLRIQKGMRSLETLVAKVPDADEDEQRRLGAQITRQCNALGTEPQDENTDL